MADVKVPTVEQFKVDPKKATQKDLDEALLLLAKARVQKEKVKLGLVKNYSKKVSEMTPEELKKYRAANQRLTTKQQILIEKAKKAGIVVTDAEIDARLKLKG